MEDTQTSANPFGDDEDHNDYSEAAESKPVSIASPNSALPEWVMEAPEEIDVLLAQREFVEAQRLLLKAERALAKVEGQQVT